MAVFFSSDLHLNHKNILKYNHKTRKEARDLDHMKELIIERFNSRCGKDDELYLLGDLTFGSMHSLKEFLYSLQVGKLHLIKGNHDNHLTNDVLQLFNTVSEYKSIKIGDDRLILMHYPIESWDHMYHGAYHLHGHCHSLNTPDNEEFHRGSLRNFTRRFDVGIDSRYDYSPWKWEEIKEFCLNRERQHGFGKVMEQGI